MEIIYFRNKMRFYHVAIAPMALFTLNSKLFSMLRPALQLRYLILIDVCL